MHVAITGASAGIGAAIARAFAAAGADLTLVARNGEALNCLAQSISVQTNVVMCDLSVLGKCTEWIANSENQLGPIDVLINNAGSQIIGATQAVEPSLGESLLSLNLATPLRLIRHILPRMIQRKAGTIVNIASIAALVPPPQMGYYSASKAGLAAASEALRGELSSSGVHVLTVYPGIIETKMGKAGLQAYQDSFAVRAQPRGDVDILATKICRAVKNKESRLIYPRFYGVLRWFPALARLVVDRYSPPLAK